MAAGDTETQPGITQVQVTSNDSSQDHIKELKNTIKQLEAQIKLKDQTMDRQYNEVEMAIELVKIEKEKTEELKNLLKSADACIQIKNAHIEQLEGLIQSRVKKTEELENLLKEKDASIQIKDAHIEELLVHIEIRDERINYDTETIAHLEKEKAELYDKLREKKQMEALRMEHTKSMRPTGPPQYGPSIGLSNFRW